MFLTDTENLPDGVGALDVKSAETDNTDDYHAVAQVVVLDPNCAVRKHNKLLVRATRLSARRFIDGYPLQPDPDTDWFGFMNQYTVFGSTAALIRKNLVLTTAHSVIPNQLGSTYLIFGRVLANDPNVTDDSLWLTIPKSRWVRVKAIRAMRKPRYNKVTQKWSGSDWALLELAEPVQGITPMPMADPQTPFSTTNTVVVSYPLGLPRKCTEVQQMGSQPSSLLTDFASGASGSPVVVNGEFWGIMEGSARFGKDDIAIDAGGNKVIRMKSLADCEAIGQPITTLDTIRAEMNSL